MSKIIMVIAAHPDDEVLGCGGTIAKHTLAGDKVFLLTLTNGETARDKRKQKKKKRYEALYAVTKLLAVHDVFHLDFPDQKMDSVPFLDIVQNIERIVAEINPNIIYTHHGSDLNLDHSITHQATMTACRPLPNSGINSILSYEVMSSTEWALNTTTHFRPNKACDITHQLDKKIEALKCYQQEMREFPHARSFESVICTAKYRGAQFGLQAAEVFFVERLFWR